MIWAAGVHAAAGLDGLEVLLQGPNPLFTPPISRSPRYMLLGAPLIGTLIRVDNAINPFIHFIMILSFEFENQILIILLFIE